MLSSSFYVVYVTCYIILNTKFYEGNYNSCIIFINVLSIYHIKPSWFNNSLTTLCSAELYLKS